MKLVVSGYRPALIDDGLYRMMDDFRAFRQKFRHSYSFELDWEKERLVAEKLAAAVSMLREQVRRFLANLENLDE